MSQMKAKLGRYYDDFIIMKYSSETFICYNKGGGKSLFIFIPPKSFIAYLSFSGKAFDFIKVAQIFKVCL